MVGTRRLELLTFPACRDALMSSAFIDQFLNGTVRFPGFQLPFPAPCFREEWDKLHDRREPTVLSDEYKGCGRGDARLSVLQDRVLLRNKTCGLFGFAGCRVLPRRAGMLK